MTVADSDALANALQKVKRLRGTLRTLLKTCSTDAHLAREVIAVVEGVRADLMGMADREKRRQIRRNARRLRLKEEGTGE